MAITDEDLALFRERARTELKSGCDVTRLAWDAVVPALCDEVTALRRKLADTAALAAADTAQLRSTLTTIKDLAAEELECSEAEGRYNRLADDIGDAADTALATLPGPGKRHDNTFVRCSECMRCGTRKCHRRDEHWPHYVIPGCVVGAERVGQYRAEKKPEPQKPQEPKKEQ